MNRTVVTLVGKDHVGIIAAESGFDKCLRNGIDFKAVHSDYGIRKTFRQFVVQLFLDFS